MAEVLTEPAEYVDPQEHAHGLARLLLELGGQACEGPGDAYVRTYTMESPSELGRRYVLSQRGTIHEADGFVPDHYVVDVQAPELGVAFAAIRRGAIFEPPEHWQDPLTEFDDLYADFADALDQEAERVALRELHDDPLLSGLGGVQVVE